MRDVALVATGGAIGAVVRYAVGRIMGPTADASIPWHTLAVNVSGAFTLGILIVLAAKWGWPGWWRPLLAVGVLGGYTTFSTFSVEVVELALHGRYGASIAYALGSLGAGVLAAVTGIAAGRAL